MTSQKPARPARIWGRLFVSIALGVMFTIWYTYVVVVWGPRAEEDEWVFGMLILFNVNFAMLLWSFYQSTRADPGEVPAFWGFHSGEQSDVKRRYCLMCNVFKPERCHHCSACNRCVLNMDHHCLWINNCVGFWNRKHFLLVLIYAQTITVLVELTLSYDFYLALEWGFTQKFLDNADTHFAKNSLVLVSFLINSMICLLITAFLKFHWTLATENKTTIENLEHDGAQYRSVYDLGRQENLAQIFGSNPWLFFLPIHSSSGRPHGDGINFGKHEAQLARQDHIKVNAELCLFSSNATATSAQNGGVDPNQEYFAGSALSSKQSREIQKRRSSLDPSPSTNHTYLQTRGRGPESPRPGSKASSRGLGGPSPSRRPNDTPSWRDTPSSQRVANKQATPGAQAAASNFRRALQVQAHLEADRAARTRGTQPTHASHCSSQTNVLRSVHQSHEGSSNGPSTMSPSNALSVASHGSLHQAQYGSQAARHGPPPLQRPYDRKQPAHAPQALRTKSAAHDSQARANSSGRIPLFK